MQQQCFYYGKKGFEDIYTKHAIRSHTLKDRQYNVQTEKDKRTTMIYNSLHRKQNNEQHEHHRKTGLKLGAPEWYVVPVP